MRPPDFSGAVSRVFVVPPPGKVWCRCGAEFENEEAWLDHARVDHDWMFKPVPYNISTAGGVFYRE